MSDDLSWPQDFIYHINKARECYRLSHVGGVDVDIDLLAPGVIREIMVASALGHIHNPANRGYDASYLDDNDVIIRCEYKTASLSGVITQFSFSKKTKAQLMSAFDRTDEFWFAAFIGPFALIPCEIHRVHKKNIVDRAMALYAGKNKAHTLSVTIDWVRANSIDSRYEDDFYGS